VKRDRDFLIYIVAATAAATILSVFPAMFDFINARFDIWPVLIGSLIGVLVTSYLTLFFRTINRHPTPLKIAIVGPPKAGKTVFLTVLFHELQILETQDISFQPYGLETIEAVSKNLGVLNVGQWLEPTSRESVFFFRANAKVGITPFVRKYTVEIGDYAGERVQEFDSSSEEWLHRTEYFKYVITSDVVFLAVDGEKLAEGNLIQLEEMQQKLIAAIQVLIDEKGVPVDQKMKTPVGLVILKSDILDKQIPLVDFEVPPEVGYRHLTEESLGDLIKLCRKRCRAFEIFFVSAVGSVELDGRPPVSLHPRNVTAPMIWALRKLRI
jgi:GTPase SAR1 family protein